jgi:hypothetical protein
MFRLLILLLLMSSCEKDEFMGNSIKPAKVTEVKKKKKKKTKRKRIKFFRKILYKAQA